MLRERLSELGVGPAWRGPSIRRVGLIAVATVLVALSASQLLLGAYGARPAHAHVMEGDMARVGGAPSAAFADGAAVDDGAFVPNRVLARFVPKAPPEHVASLLSDMDCRRIGAVPALGVSILYAPPGRERDVAAILQRHPLVEYAELDAIVDATYVPDDPDYNDSSLVYGPQRVNAPEAWDHTLGDSAVTVAILDTGVSIQHEDLVGRMVDGWDFANDDSDPSDDNGHGTHMAGVAAAGTDNATGMAGMAQASIMPMKVLSSSGSGSHSDIAAAITWAVDHGADVLNMSFGGTISTQTLHSAVQYAYSAGVPIVAAAGNDNSSQPFYPAAYEECLAVSATTATDERWSMSNYGDFVDLAAPGASIWSTIWTSANPTSAYASMSGTSPAAPHVTGTVALVLAAAPDMAPADLYALMTQAVVDLGDAGWDPYFGYGRIDAGSAVAGALSGTPTSTPTPAPSNTPTSTPEVSPTPTPFARRGNGGGGTYIDIAGSAWSADQLYAAGSWGYIGGSAKSGGQSVTGTEDDSLYQKHREDPGAYRFTVPDGTYQVELRFAEFVVTNSTDRQARITIEGTVVENALSIYGLVGRYAALDRTYSATVTDGVLDIEFAKNGGKRNPIVSAINVTAP